jgi:hypothetical protein
MRLLNQRDAGLIFVVGDGATSFVASAGSGSSAALLSTSSSLPKKSVRKNPGANKDTGLTLTLGSARLPLML